MKLLIVNLCLWMCVLGTEAQAQELRFDLATVSDQPAVRNAVEECALGNRFVRGEGVGPERPVAGAFLVCQSGRAGTRGGTGSSWKHVFPWTGRGTGLYSSRVLVQESSRARGRRRAVQFGKDVFAWNLRIAAGYRESQLLAEEGFGAGIALGEHPVGSNFRSLRPAPIAGK